MILLLHVFQQKTPKKDSAGLGRALRTHYSEHDIALLPHFSTEIIIL